MRSLNTSNLLISDKDLMAGNYINIISRDTYAVTKHIQSLDKEPIDGTQFV